MISTCAFTTNFILWHFVLCTLCNFQVVLWVHMIHLWGLPGDISSCSLCVLFFELRSCEATRFILWDFVPGARRIFFTYRCPAKSQDFPKFSISFHPMCTACNVWVRCSMRPFVWDFLWRVHRLYVEFKEFFVDSSSRLLIGDSVRSFEDQPDYTESRVGSVIIRRPLSCTWA